MAMTFPGAKLLPGWHCVFLGKGQMLLGKTPPFPGTLKQFLGISIAPGLLQVRVSVAMIKGLLVLSQLQRRGNE
jgi:hypothetical protein